jgi:phage-related protein
LGDTKARPIVWVGDSRKQVRNFPMEVKKEVGDALFDVQMGTTPPDAKPLKGVGSGVFEIVTRHDTNTYRTVYAVQIGSRIYVLHAFQKKSKKDIKTAKKDVDLIKRRYQQALEMEKQK